MTKKIEPGIKSGCVNVPDSKSLLHRHLICKALSGAEISNTGNFDSEDIHATLNCLNSICKLKCLTGKADCDSILNTAVSSEKIVDLYCGESGSTLRFLLPVAAALGISAVFHLGESLSHRPQNALIQVLSQHGAHITFNNKKICLFGKLHAGDYAIPGNISSQYISGLLFALPLLEENSHLVITTKVQSRNYLQMTESTLSQYGIVFDKNGDNYQIPGKQNYVSPGFCEMEKDWSAAAFFLCMGAFSEQGIFVQRLKTNSLQGDSAVLEILKKYGANTAIYDDGIKIWKGHLVGQRIHAEDIPDLIPALAVLSAGAEGITEITGADRLRYKESDRLKSTTAMLKTLGSDIRETANGLIIAGKPFLKGGYIDPVCDHRIAMAAAEAAGICHEPVIIKNAECVRKSFPDFWRILNQLKTENQQ